MSIEHSNKKIQYFQNILMLIIGALIGFLSAYFSEKGKNLATKEDIELITSKIEGIKSQYAHNQMIELEKRKLKHEALLDALSMVDAYYSHVLTRNVPKSPTKQYATIKEVRECHNKLILSVDNPNIIKMFLEIMIPQDKDSIPPTDRLNSFRNMIRNELGYGKELILDRDYAWFGTIVFEKNTPPH